MSSLDFVNILNKKQRNQFNKKRMLLNNEVVKHMPFSVRMLRYEYKYFHLPLNFLITMSFSF